MSNPYSDSAELMNVHEDVLVQKRVGNMLANEKQNSQTIQAQLGERTHFGQMSQQHYNLALAEIKSYIENNPKTLATAMAMQGAK